MKEIKICKKHGECTHTYRDNRWRCNKCLSEAVQKRRDILKMRAVEYKGGKCEKCGYDKCISALEFHHLDPSEKEFTITQGYIKSWEKTKIELDKCILVCSNCHREIHYMNVDDTKRNLTLYKVKDENRKFCPICGEEKSERASLCVSCYNKSSRKVERPSKELLELEIKQYSYVALGKKYGVSDNAVRKWCKSYGLI